MRAVIPILYAYLHLFSPCSPSANTATPNHIAAPPQASPSAPFDSKATLSPPNTEDVPVTFNDKEIPLSEEVLQQQTPDGSSSPPTEGQPEEQTLDKRSAHHFDPRPPCKEPPPKSKAKLLGFLKNRQKPHTGDCIPQPILDLKSESNDELNSREKFDREVGSGQQPIKMAMVTDTDATRLDEAGRRKSWDHEYARRKQGLLVEYGRRCEIYLM
ncbi:hypothetical protein MMC08_005207 [Hypocenomyce scalaris]|nr:hypothetical protein [Hypocenomyce scalaris]